MYEFKAQVKSQVEYYELFRAMVRDRKNVASVQDAELSDDLKGPDLFVRTDKGDILRIQVKVDHIADISGNIPIETISQAYTNRNSVIGAEFNMCEIDYIFFILSKTKQVYGYKFSRLLEYVIANYEQFRNYGANNPTVQDAWLSCTDEADRAFDNA